MKSGGARDEAKAFGLFQRAASAGHARALNSVGSCHMMGCGVSKDEAKAVEFFEKAAALAQDETGASALYNLARALSDGQGVAAKDPRRTFELYGKAATLGDLDALFSVALCHLQGMGTHKDPKKDVELLQRAVDSGQVEAISHLGLCYQAGIGVAKDAVRALQVFETGANLNDAASLYQLAQVCSAAKSDKWLDYVRRAIKLGHGDAMLMLGVAYQKGKGGVILDPTKAVELFKMAHQSDEPAWVLLLEGRGVSVDAKRGVSYFEQAANTGDAVGLFNLANAWSNGEGVPRKDDETAFHLYRRAADAEDVDAVFTVAMCFATGAGVDVDVRAAVEWMQKAANMSSASALFKLGEWYELGLCEGGESTLPKDVSKSMDSFRKSMLAGSKRAEEEYRRLILQSLPESVKRGTKKQVAQYVRILWTAVTQNGHVQRSWCWGKKELERRTCITACETSRMTSTCRRMVSMCTRFIQMEWI